MFRVWENIIDFFKKRIFPFKGNVFKTKEEEIKDKLKEKSQEELKEYINNTFTFIEEQSEVINNDLFRKYSDFQHLLIWRKKLFETKDAKENSKLIEEIKNRWGNLKDETNKISKEEIENEKPNKILEIVNEIIDFNKEIEKQQGSGLKILTPNQMLSRLLITLAQLKAENNSE